VFDIIDGLNPKRADKESYFKHCLDRQAGRRRERREGEEEEKKRKEIGEKDVF
jgi:hypothetical protein